MKGRDGGTLPKLLQCVLYYNVYLLFRAINQLGLRISGAASYTVIHSLIPGLHRPNSCADQVERRISFKTTGKGSRANA